MPTTLIRDLIAANEGNEPETFQFLTEHDPENSWFEHLFAIDLRALAVLRILLGIISLAFIANQFASIELLYSDDGLLSRSINKQLVGSGYWSILWINGSFNFARTMLIITVLIACVFTLGFQTKIMNVALLVLIWSIQVRNPLVLTGGDILLRMLLFWSIFLPNNMTWSVDASQMDDRPGQWKVASIGSLAIMLQVVFMYFFTGVAKLNPFWLNGDAIEYAMNLEMSVKPLGQWLSSYSWVMYFATLATLLAEIFILFLVFIPRINHFNRGMMLGFFLMFHIGIWLTLSIGLFSVTAIAAWVIFIPSDIWNTWLGQPVGFSEKRFYRMRSVLMDKISKIVCAIFLVYITVQNLVFAFGPSLSERFRSLELIGRSTMTIQQFHMFAQPPVFSPWFEYNAQLDSGERVDLFYPNRKDTLSKPKSVYNYMQTQNWRRIHWNLITHPIHPPETELIYQQIRRRLLQTAVEKWDSEFIDDPVIEAELRCHLEPIELNRDAANQPEFRNLKSYDLIWAIYNNNK